MIDIIVLKEIMIFFLSTLFLLNFLICVIFTCLYVKFSTSDTIVNLSFTNTLFAPLFFNNFKQNKLKQIKTKMIKLTPQNHSSAHLLPDERSLSTHQTGDLSLLLTADDTNGRPRRGLHRAHRQVQPRVLKGAHWYAFSLHPSFLFSSLFFHSHSHSHSLFITFLRPYYLLFYIIIYHRIILHFNLIVL